MKIAHIFASYPNKYQPYNLSIIDVLKKTGHIVKIFSLSFSGKLDNETIYLFNNPSIIKKLNCIIFDILRLCKYKKYCNQTFRKVLISYSRYRPLLYIRDYSLHIHHIQLIHGDFFRFLNCFEIEYVISIRGSDIAIYSIANKVYKNNIMLALNNAHSIHAVSSDLSQKVEEIINSNDNIFVIPRYIERKLIKRRVINSNKSNNILSVGRYHWVKGYNYILEALAKVKEEKIHFSYVICGDGNEEETKQLKYLINLYELNDEVELVGFINNIDIDRYYSTADIYICGSLYEGMPNAVINAIDFQIPIIATSVGGIPEIIKDNINGLLCKPADSNDIKNKLFRILNKEWKPQFTKSVKTPRAEEILKKYLDLYENIDNDSLNFK